MDRLRAAAEAYSDDVGGARPSRELNRLLYTSERVLTRREGLPGRPWYKHYVYAPGYYTGYGVKTLPAVREAIEQREYDAVEGAVADVAEVLNAMAARIETITRAL